MVPKRVKQFYINLTDRMNKEDYEFVEKILNDKEYAIFKKMLKSEQKHSVRIAKDIKYTIDNNLVYEDIKNHKDLLIKVALLHDVGKSKSKINIIDKSIIVILNKITKGELQNLKKSKKIQCYYNHSEYSYDILKNIIDDEVLLNIIRNHHSDINDKLIKFFKEIDDRN